MPLHPTWSDLGLRLALTALAGGLIGYDRSINGHPAGLRTTILVAVAAAVAMVQANLLLRVDGRTSGAFSTMDVMRLPLGILTGVGFIGGGAILKRGELILGVTTAATLWVATVIGLCFGGGQIALGLAATVIACLTLSALKWLDLRIPREQRARVVIRAQAGTAPSVLADLVRPLGFEPRFRSLTEDPRGGQVRLEYDMRWRRAERAPAPFELAREIAAHFPLLVFDLNADPRE